MPLPYPTKVILPFDIATAQDMNERHANDVALANGSGLDDGAVTTAKLADGAVTAQKIDFTSLGAFNAYLVSNQSLSAAAYTKLNMNATSLNINNVYSTTNSRFTAPYNCVAFFSANITNTGSSVSGTCAIYLNGNQYARAPFSPTSTITPTVSTIIPLSAGDVVECYGYMNTAATIPSNSSTAFWLGYVIART